jgi:AcrR family transcriptional regulator
VPARVATPDRATTRRRPGRPRHDGPTAAFLARQQEIIDTAIDVFHDRGFEAGSLDDVAASLGVSKASLYHYVPSKAHLLYLIFDRAISTTLERMHGLAAIDDPAERLRALIRQQVATIAADQPMFRVFFGDRPALDAQYQQTVRDKERELFGLLRDAVVAAMDAGVLPAGDPRLTAQAVLGMTSWFHQWYQEGRDDPAEFAATCIALVLPNE